MSIQKIIETVEQEVGKKVSESVLPTTETEIPKDNEFAPNAFSTGKASVTDFSTIPLSPVDAFNASIRDYTLPDDMVISAVNRACSFFNISEAPVVNADSTCVWPSDNSSLKDDILGFNRKQLMDMGISGEESLTLIYTHECAHRTLQGVMTDTWKEELACDYFAGVNAGLNNINLDNFEASLGCTDGGATHPNGALRSEFIEYGRKVVEELQQEGLEVTYDNCLKQFEEHFQEKAGLISEYRHRFDPERFSLAGASMLEDDLGLAKGFVNDKEWNMKQANKNFENAKYHEKEAEKAAARGDYAAAKDHLYTAKTYQSKGEDYLKSANNSTK